MLFQKSTLERRKFSGFSLKKGMGILGSILVLQCVDAVALDLTAPFFLETARTLPKGVRNPRFVNVFMSIDSKFSDIGNAQPLANPIDRSVRWSDVIDMEKDSIKKLAISALLQANQIDSQGGPGKTTGQVYSVFNVKVPALAIGLSDRFTVGVGIPIVKIDVSADTGFQKNPDGQKFAERLCAASPVECTTAAARFNNAVNDKLTNYGYAPVASSSSTHIGDVQIIGKYSLYQDEVQGFALKSTFVLPTGRVSDVNAAVDLPTGDGRFQVGGVATYDRVFASDYRWNTYGGIQALMPFSQERRVPVELGNPVSNEKETLTRNLAGLITAGTSIVRKLGPTGVSIGAGYNLQYMTGASYSGGTQYAPQRYGYLEALTPAQTLHSATVVAGFSTVEWFQQKKFIYPFQANLIFSHPFSGRNAPNNDVVAGELVLFF
ncbi:MAG: hypothetical protein HYX41_06330 [Bdellovibrio sp.]|nr:hypothetical protein [Bdellovibrio sp.]